LEAGWNWLITPPGANSVFDPFGAAFFVVFSIGFVASSYLLGPGAGLIAKNASQLAGLKRWATIGLSLFGTGLFFFGVRALQINPLWFGAPVWMVMCVVALIIAANRCFNWWRTERGSDGTPK
jgi:hypothetical protein